MKDLKEIIAWYRSYPPKPTNLTSIQEEEWRRTDGEKLQNNFVGEKIIFHAFINNITNEKILAYVDCLGKHGESVGTFIDEEDASGPEFHSRASFEIDYDKNLFFEKLKTIYKGNRMEFEGIIITCSFGQRANVYKPKSTANYGISINIKLTDLRYIRGSFKSPHLDSFF